MKVDLVLLITILASLCGIYIGWAAKSKSDKDEVRDKAAHDATVTADINHMNDGISRIEKQMEKIIENQDKNQEHIEKSIKEVEDKTNDSIKELTARVIKTEQSLKSAHKRMGDMNNKIDQKLIISASHS